MSATATASRDVISPNFRDLRQQLRQGASKHDHELIASDRVEDTAVFRPDGEKIGHIHHLMVGKRSGLVEHAVMSFGGFLGMGKEMRPVPWEALDYDVDKGGYVVTAEEDVLRKSPSYERETEPPWDTQYNARVYSYWGVPY